MEIVLNNYQGCRNHLTVISELIDNSSDIRLAVAFVKSSGVENVIERLKGKKVKILCSLSFLLTEHEALRRLLDEGHHLKFYNAERGMLHSKVWIFKNSSCHKVLIGSANLSTSALIHNMEASVLFNKNEAPDEMEIIDGYFKYLWNKKSLRVDKNLLSELSRIEKGQKSIYDATKQLSKLVLPKDKVKHLFESIKSWMDIDANIKIPGTSQSKLWRGWYVIPDQGIIDDDLMLLLKKVLEIILREGMVIDTLNDAVMRKIYAITDKTVDDAKELNSWQLFRRRQYNYLEKFGFIYNPLSSNGSPNTKLIKLTDSGLKIAKLKNSEIEAYKEIYATNMNEYHFNGIYPFPFVMELLIRFDYLDYFEFSSFVKHFYNNDRVDLAASLIAMYRSCSDEEKQDLQKMYKEYFNNVLEPTAKSVRGNYEKSIKHHMSSIGWMPNCEYDRDAFVLRMI